jgi:hypothetical protein
MGSEKIIFIFVSGEIPTAPSPGLVPRIVGGIELGRRAASGRNPRGPSALSSNCEQLQKVRDIKISKW